MNSNHAPKQNFYELQKTVCNLVDERLEEVISKDSSLNINRFVYNLTKVHAVSTKFILKRIDMFVELNKDNVVILDGEVIKK